MNKIPQKLQSEIDELEKNNIKIQDTLGSSIYGIDILGRGNITELEKNKIIDSINNIMKNYENFALKGIGSHYYKEGVIYDNKVKGSVKINILGKDDLNDRSKCVLLDHLYDSMDKNLEGFNKLELSNEVIENIKIFFSNIYESIMHEKYVSPSPLKKIKISGVQNQS